MRPLSQLVASVGLLAVGVVLVSGPSFSRSDSDLGGEVVRHATAQELDLLRRGPVDQAGIRQAEGWTVACLRKHGFDVRVDQLGALRSYSRPLEGGDSRPRFSSDMSRVDAIVRGCEHLSEAVRAAYRYDHTSFWSWSRPLPGIGRALRDLRSSFRP